MPASPRTDEPTLRLRPPRNRIEPKAVLWWTLRSLIRGGLLVVALAVPYMMWEVARPWLLAPLIVVSTLAVVNVLVQPRWRYAVHRWESTDNAVYGLSGWLVREWRVAPISRIQTVDAVRGPLEQILGLSTLRVTTASSRGAISIVGLDRETAAKWAERLTLLTEQSEGDAT